MMVDEIQTGFGRTGTWFGFQHDGVVPDVVDDGQGDRQRHARRRLLGQARGRRGVPAGRPRQHVQRHRARHRGGERGDRRDAPHRRTAPGARPQVPCSPTSLAGRCRGSATVRGRGLLLAAELADGVDAPDGVPRAARRGLVANAVTPTALRFAPPLTVIDDEIDEAVGNDRRWCCVVTCHLLDVTDLVGRRARRQSWTWPRRPIAELGRPLDGPGRGADLREAVDPHTPVDGDGRRRSSAVIPSTRGATRSASTSASRSRTSRASWRATTRDRGPGVRPLECRADGGVADVPIVNMLSRPVPIRCRRSPTR